MSKSFEKIEWLNSEYKGYKEFIQTLEKAAKDDSLEVCNVRIGPYKFHKYLSDIPTINSIIESLSIVFQNKNLRKFMVYFLYPIVIDCNVIDPKRPEIIINAIFELLSANNSLEHLKIALECLDRPSENPSQNELKFLGKMIECNSYLKFLDLSSSYLTNDSLVQMSKALQKNKTITSLKLGFYDFNHSGIDSLALALKENTSLTYLYLEDDSEQFIEDKHIYYAEQIGEAIGANNSLLNLELKKTFFCYNASQIFIKGLRKNQSIINLHITRGGTYFELSSQEVVALLNENNRMQEVVLHGNRLDDDITGNIIMDYNIASILFTLKNNITLTHLRLAGFLNLDDQCFSLMGEFLTTNNTLIDFRLDEYSSCDCEYDVEASSYISIAKALEVNKTLMYLYLPFRRNNTIPLMPASAVAAFISALNINKTLIELQLADEKLLPQPKEIKESLNRNRLGLVENRLIILLMFFNQFIKQEKNPVLLLQACGDLYRMLHILLVMTYHSILLQKRQFHFFQKIH